MSKTEKSQIFLSGWHWNHIFTTFFFSFLIEIIRGSAITAMTHAGRDERAHFLGAPCSSDHPNGSPVLTFHLTFVLRDDFFILFEPRRGHFPSSLARSSQETSLKNCWSTSGILQQPTHPVRGRRKRRRTEKRETKRLFHGILLREKKKWEKRKRLLLHNCPSLWIRGTRTTGPMRNPAPTNDSPQQLSEESAQQQRCCYHRRRRKKKTVSQLSESPRRLSLKYLQNNPK